MENNLESEFNYFKLRLDINTSFKIEEDKLKELINNNTPDAIVLDRIWDMLYDGGIKDYIDYFFIAFDITPPTIAKVFPPFLENKIAASDNKSSPKNSITSINFKSSLKEHIIFEEFNNLSKQESSFIPFKDFIDAIFDSLVFHLNINDNLFTEDNLRKNLVKKWERLNKKVGTENAVDKIEVIDHIKKFDSIIKFESSNKPQANFDDIFFVNDINKYLFYSIIENWKICPLFNSGKRQKIDKFIKLSCFLYEVLFNLYDISDQLNNSIIFEKTFHISFVSELLFILNEIYMNNKLTIKSDICEDLHNKVINFRKSDINNISKVINKLVDLCKLPNVFSREHILYIFLYDFYNAFERNFDKWEHYVDEFINYFTNCIIPLSEKIFKIAINKYLLLSTKNQDDNKIRDLYNDLLKDYIENLDDPDMYLIDYTKLENLSFVPNKIEMQFTKIQKSVYNYLMIQPDYISPESSMRLAQEMHSYSLGYKKNIFTSILL